MAAFAIPLAGAADAMVARLARATASPAIAAFDGATLLGERAALVGLRVPGDISAGGGCRLIPARGGVIALNLARDSDRELLPALFRDDGLDAWNDAAINAATAALPANDLVARARLFGLAAAAIDEPATPPAPALLTIGEPARAMRERPRIVDLSALWAGPLAAHLLALAGADVVKVESPARPDRMRDGQPDFYRLLNQGKASVALDLRAPADRAALLALIDTADIVIEAARPRALAQLDIDADAIVRGRPGLVWLTIVAHGATGEAANWIGFGDDVGVAAGLSAALRDATGRVGFIGDAIADPLTGLMAAVTGWEAWAAGRGGRYAVVMRDIARSCLDAERSGDPGQFAAKLRGWAGAAGQAFPFARGRTIGLLPEFGADPPRWRS